MKSNFLTAKGAVRAMCTVYALVIIFHILVIAGLISPDVVWGGNLHSRTQLLTMELLSISINLLMFLFCLGYLGILKNNVSFGFYRAGFWLMFVLFTLNTIGNLFAKSSLETLIFTPITLVLAVFSLIAALNKPRILS